jgi:hypothetical protein
MKWIEMTQGGVKFTVLNTVYSESRRALRLRYVDVQCLYRRSWILLPTTL